MTSPQSLVLYHADQWGSAGPVLRVVGPAEAAGLRVLRGNVWERRALAEFFPQRVAEADWVVIQRDFPQFTAAYDEVMARARAAGKPVIYELDDLIMELPPEHPARPFQKPAGLGMLRAILEADGVTVTSDVIADYVRPYNPHVWVLPNYLDDRLWPLPEPTPAAPGPLVLGYIGGYTHGPDLALIEPVVARLLERYGPRLKFTVWGASPPPASLRGRPGVEWNPLEVLDYAEYVTYISRQHADLCIAPLQDHLFNRGKSAIKFLEYSALGAAGVYSRLPPYAAVISDGRDGYLAGTADEWERRLTQLIEDQAAREAMRRAAYQTVSQRWRLTQHAHEWRAAYAAIAEAPRHVSPQAAEVRVAQLAQRWYAELQADQEQLIQQRLKTVTGQPAYAAAQTLQAWRRTLAPDGSRRARWLDHLARLWLSRRPAAQPPHERGL